MKKVLAATAVLVCGLGIFVFATASTYLELHPNVEKNAIDIGPEPHFLTYTRI